MKRAAHVTIIERFLPLAVVLTVVAIALITLYPFLPAVLWGTMVAIALEPRYKWLAGKLGGRRTLSSWIIGLFLALAIVIPALGLARALISFLTP